MAQATEWFLDDDSLWHTPKEEDRSRTHCGRKWRSVQRVTTGIPPTAAVCPSCHSQLAAPTTAKSAPHTPSSTSKLALPVAQNRKKKANKALRKKMDELRKKGIREDLLEPLATDALSRGSAASRSVRPVSGGLPTLGKGHH